jgi:hypothetical protein
MHKGIKQHIDEVQGIYAVMDVIGTIHTYHKEALA